MAVHALATFLGAFLLFFCQPMMGRFLLPWFGGGAAVWTVSLLFFQVGLVAGYAYAHVLSRLSGKLQVGVHCSLLVLTAVTQNVVPGEAWRPEGGEDPTWAALRILAAHIGLPYLLLSATAPLIQSWFARVHPGESPYRLYATSNLAALIALFGYPFLFEPALRRGEQAFAWQMGFGLLVVCFLVAGRGMRRAGVPDVRESSASVGGWHPLWLILPGLSSALLLAVTNRLSENVPPFPFLWVLPLSLHLLSFVLCFRERPLYHRGLFVRLFGVGALLLAGQLHHQTPDFLWHLVLQNTVLFCACMVMHGELYRRRPRADGLTGYYLAIATGGALGGVLVAIVSPAVFERLSEFPLLLIATTAVAFWTGRRDPRPPSSLWASVKLESGLVPVVLLGYLGLQAFNEEEGVIHRSRNFFGTQTVKVIEEGTPRARYEYGHGVIVHGMQYLGDGFRHLPTAYFTPISGIGLAWNDLAQDRPRHVGVIGLGVGTLAAYGRPGDRIRFYEIDPKVIAVANELFFYLKESKADVEVILGDGRSSLEAESEKGFDLLVLDAFSGDAPPAHLLTQEAFELYRDHLAPGGIIAVNVTNVYLDLLDLVATQARELGLAGVWISQGEDPTHAALKSTWVLLAERPSAFGPGVLRQANRLDGFGERASIWTDEFSAPKEILNW